MSAPAATDLRNRTISCVAVALILVYVAFQGLVDLDPPSLWLDDAWVVALSNAPAYGIALVQPASAPPLFMVLVGLATDFFTDLELGAQCFPFLFGLIVVALTARLTYRISENVVCTIVATAIVATDSSFLVYIARVKPFTGDMLVVLLLGIRFHQLTRAYSRRSLWAYTGVAIVGFTLSSLSILVAAAGSTVAWLFLWREGVRDRHLGYAGLALSAAVAWVVFRITSQPSADLLLDYWTRAYLPTDSVAAFASGLLRVSTTWANRLAHAGPYASGVIAGSPLLTVGLAAIGSVWLWREDRRLHLLTGLLVVVVCIFASAAGWLPLGTNRVGLFLLPFGAVLVSCALGFVEHLPSRGRAVAIALVFVGALVLLPPKRTQHYPLQVSAPLFERVAGLLRVEDGLWINHATSYAAGIYGPWDYELAHDPRYAIPRPDLEHPGFAVLEEDEGRVVALPSTPTRTYVVLCHAKPRLLASLEALLAAGGYRAPHIVERNPGCTLSAYRR